jgi:hypothetical protein
VKSKTCKNCGWREEWNESKGDEWGRCKFLNGEKSGEFHYDDIMVRGYMCDQDVGVHPDFVCCAWKTK